MDTLGAPGGSPIPSTNRRCTTSAARFLATKMLPPMYWWERSTAKKPPCERHDGARMYWRMQEQGQNALNAKRHPPCNGRIPTFRNRKSQRGTTEALLCAINLTTASHPHTNIMLQIMLSSQHKSVLQIAPPCNNPPQRFRENLALLWGRHLRDEGQRSF